MRDIRLIALDLDGTLLNSRKELTRRSYDALRQAAESGIEIVPTTGRFYAAMPEVIRSLPFVRYVIAINGAQILDTRTGESLFRAELAWEDAVEIMAYLDKLPVIYDCFMDDAAWMSESQKEKIDAFAPDEHYRKMFHELRRPVPELKDFLRQRKQNVQKTQCFFRDMSLREELLRELPRRFPRLLVSSSVVNNVEVNHPDAHKGNAITWLAGHLGFGVEQVVSFGDGLNDITMLETAGLGVAMANAGDEIKAHADLVCESCDDEGVARQIQRLLEPNTHRKDERK